MTHAVGGYPRGRLRTTAYAWVHGTTENWNRRRSIRHPNRAQAFERLTDPQRIGCFTHARDCACPSGSVSRAGRTEESWQGWSVVLGCVVDWWSSSSVRVARRSDHESVVSQLRQDLRTRRLAGYGRDESLVHVAERAGCDSSSGETDRADGCSMHSVDEFAWVHSKRQGETWSCRDKGGQ